MRKDFGDFHNEPYQNISSLYYFKQETNFGDLFTLSEHIVLILFQTRNKFWRFISITIRKIQIILIPISTCGMMK